MAAKSAGSIKFTQSFGVTQHLELERQAILSCLGKARDDTAAMTVDADRTAFAKTFAGLVGVFQLTREVVGHLIDAAVRMLVT